MTKKDLLGAFETLTPDRETKKKMLLALEEKASKPAARRLPFWGGAVVVAVAFLLLWIVVPKGDWFVPKAGTEMVQSPEALQEEADVVSAPRADATSAPTESEEETKMGATPASAEEPAEKQTITNEYAEGEFWIMEIEGVEDLDALIYLIPEDAVLIGSGDTFLKYKVGEEIWEIKIEDGLTRLIKPLDE